MTRFEFNHALFVEDRLTRREAFLHLKSISDFDGPTKGCFWKSERQLAKDWGWDRNAVHRFLKALLSNGLIEQVIIENEPLAEQKPNQNPSQNRTTEVQSSRTVKSSVTTNCEPRVIGYRTTNRTSPIYKDLKNKEENNKPPTPISNLPLDLPPSLSTPEFAYALTEWIEFKAEMGKRYKDRGLQALISKLEKMGADRAVAAIAHSMAQNYQGIYEENKGSGARQTSAAQAHAEMLDLQRRGL